MKRFLSTLLMICMLITLFPAAASAAGVVVTAHFVDNGGEAITELPDQALTLAEGDNAMNAFVPVGYKGLEITVGGSNAATIAKAGDEYMLPDATVLNASFTVVFKLKKLPVVTAQFVDEGGEAIADLPARALALTTDGTEYTLADFIPVGYEKVSIQVDGADVTKIKRVDSEHYKVEGTIDKTESFTVVFKLKKLLGVAINSVNFPDPNFRTYVKSFDTGSYTDFLTIEELAAVTAMDCKGKDIATLAGISNFTALETLDCRNNKLTALELSANTGLRSLLCSSNATLTSLNIKGLANLTVLECSGCALTTLDINDSSALETLVHELTVDPSTNPRVYDKDGNRLVFDETAIVTHMPNWEESKVITEPTCTAKGEREMKCTLCDRTKTEEIDMVPHVQGDGVLDPPPTTTTEGKRKFYCKVCNLLLKEETVPKVDSNAVELTQLNFFDTTFLDKVSAFDADHNGYLDKTEIEGITSLDCSALGITSLRGVEFLTSLEELYCENNELSALDVSKNTKLKKLSCFGNKLSSLSLTKNTALELLSCGDNKIASLDLSKNTKLQMLSCKGNKLTSLDLSENKLLTILECRENSISSLNITACTKLTELYCASNKLSSLDITKNTQLKTLECGGNPLGSLDIESTPKFIKLVHEADKESKDGVDSFSQSGVTLAYPSSTSVKHLPSWDSGKEDPKADCEKKVDGKITYTCTVDDCGRTKVKVIPYADVHNWKSTGVYTIEPTDTTPGRLIYECTKCHEKKEVEVPALQDGIEINEKNFPDQAFRNFVIADIDNDKSGILTKDEIKAVVSMDVSAKGIKSLKGIEHFTELEELNADSNELSALDVSKNLKLKKLNCSGNAITNLNLSANEQLVELFCSGNEMKTLNVSQCVALEKLFCYSNSITSLDLSRLLALRLLDCADNKLPVLSLSANKALTAVNAADNQLASITLSNNSSLTKLSLARCPIASVNVGGCENLRILDLSGTSVADLDISMNPALMNAYKNGVKTQISLIKYKIDCYTLDKTADPGTRELRLSYGCSPADGLYYNYMLCVSPTVKLTAENHATIVNRSLFLKGNVGLNFYVTLPENFSITGNAHAELNGISVDFPKPNSRGEYLFTYYGAAKQMRDSVVLKLFDADGNLFPMRLKDGTDVTTGYDFSVQKYFDLAHESSTNELLLTLLDRMSDYGYYAQLAFKYNNAGVVITGEMLSNISGVSVDSVSAYKPTITGSYDGGMVHDGSSLILSSETSIRHYFKLTKGELSNYTFVVDGTNVTPKEKDGDYYVEVKHIAAKDLDVAHSVQVKNKSGEVVASVENYSALSYVYTVLTTGALGNQDTVNLAKGLYNYNKAADAYFASVS